MESKLMWLGGLLIVAIFIRSVAQRYLPLPRYSGASLVASYPAEFGLMPEPEFWRLIEAARQGGHADYETQCELLGDELATLSPAEIIAFDRTFDVLMAASYDARLWEAAAAINGGCSDDCFEYFRSWLIAQGRDKFYWSLRHPRLLLLTGRAEWFQNYEGIAYVALNQYEAKTGREIPDAVHTPSYELVGELNTSSSIFRYPELSLLVW